MRKEIIKVGFWYGYGRFGVLKILEMNREAGKNRAGAAIEVKKILSGTCNKKRPLKIDRQQLNQRPLGYFYMILR